MPVAELAAPELTSSGSQLLAGVAAALLLFVSGGVIYLSAVEWRDRRRRARDARESAGRSGGAAKTKGKARRRP